MNIVKAIALLRLEISGPYTFEEQDLHDATMLGVEALEHIRHQADPDHQAMRQLLPGETLE